MSEYLNYDEFLVQLRRMVENRADAGLRMVTDAHHFVGITIRGGAIVALHYGPNKGRRALADICRMRSGALTVGDATPYPPQADLPATAEILRILGERDAESALVPNPPRAAAPGPAPRQLEPQALERVRAALLQCIGPIANLLVKDVAGQMGGIHSDADLARLVDALAEEIDDPAQAARFRSQALGT
jgi:hypothetical protein